MNRTVTLQIRLKGKGHVQPEYADSKRTRLKPQEGVYHICIRTFLCHSGWRFSQPPRRASGAVRRDQRSQGLAGGERSGCLSSNQECPLSERISGIFA